jgi:hypothetical protein
MRRILDPEPRFSPSKSGKSENSPDFRRTVAPLVVRFLVPLIQNFVQNFVHQLVYLTVCPIGVDLVFKRLQHVRASLLGIVDIPISRLPECVPLAALDQRIQQLLVPDSCDRSVSRPCRVEDE